MNHSTTKLPRAMLALAALPLLAGCAQVNSGEVGIVTQFGAVTGQVLEPGLHFINPIGQGVERMDIQTHAYKAGASAATHDLQNVATDVTLNYALAAGSAIKVYTTLRRDYEERIIKPTVQEAVKSITAKYEATQLITEREAVRNGIAALLTERLARHGLIVDQVSITNFQFDPEFAAAIEAKVVSTQLALKAENDLKTIKTQAEQRIAAARGEAEAIRIQAEAVEHQGGAAYVQLEAIKRWNGSVPQWINSYGQVPFINLERPKQR